MHHRKTRRGFVTRSSLSLSLGAGLKQEATIISVECSVCFRFQAGLSVCSSISFTCFQFQTPPTHVDVVGAVSGRGRGRRDYGLAGGRGCRAGAVLGDVRRHRLHLDDGRSRTEADGLRQDHWWRRERGRLSSLSKAKLCQLEGAAVPGLVWSMAGRPCRMRVLAGAGVWGTGRVATHTGRGWMGGLVLRMVLAFNEVELGRTSGEKNKTSRFISISCIFRNGKVLFSCQRVSSCFSQSKVLNVQHRSYADDTQVYVSVSPNAAHPLGAYF